MSDASPRPEPSTLQRRVLDYVVEYVLRRHYPPSQREIAKRLGCALSSVHRSFVALEGTGYIEWERGRSRSVRVV